MDGERPSAESAWAALSYPVFRALWMSSLVSNIGTWMQNVGAAWAMTSLSPSPLMVALVQSATSLPVFIVGMPAGAVADIVDRRRLLLVTQTWMLAAAALMALLSWADLMTRSNPARVDVRPRHWGRDERTDLAGDHCGTGAAVRADTRGGPERAAVNIGRAVGPAMGGVLVAAAGPALVFALNAASFVAVIVVVYRWRREAPRAVLPAERVIGATRAGIRYARYAPPLVAVLVRTGLFIICGSAFWALLPVIARRDLRPRRFGLRCPARLFRFRGHCRGGLPAACEEPAHGRRGRLPRDDVLRARERAHRAVAFHSRSRGRDDARRRCVDRHDGEPQRCGTNRRPRLGAGTRARHAISWFSREALVWAARCGDLRRSMSGRRSRSCHPPGAPSSDSRPSADGRYARSARSISHRPRTGPNRTSTSSREPRKGQSSSRSNTGSIRKDRRICAGAERSRADPAPGRRRDLGRLPRLGEKRAVRRDIPRGVVARTPAPARTRHDT